MSLFLSRLRRRGVAQRPTEGLNLVPLVDILTSIVFFSLLTYGGGAVLLTSLDLAASAMDAPSDGPNATVGTPVRLTVWVDSSGLRVEDIAAAGATRSRLIAGLGDDALAELRRHVLAATPAEAPTTVVVIPADDLSYQRLVEVLSAIRAAGEPQVALGGRPRG